MFFFFFFLSLKLYQQIGILYDFSVFCQLGSGQVLFGQYVEGRVMQIDTHIFIYLTSIGSPKLRERQRRKMNAHIKK